jgi:hypothetical protein
VFTEASLIPPNKPLRQRQEGSGSVISLRRTTRNHCQRQQGEYAWQQKRLSFHQIMTLSRVSKLGRVKDKHTQTNCMKSCLINLVWVSVLTIIVVILSLLLHLRLYLAGVHKETFFMLPARVKKLPFLLSLFYTVMRQFSIYLIMTFCLTDHLKPFPRSRSCLARSSVLLKPRVDARRFTSTK